MSARETVGKTFLVAGILCVVCSILVSMAAVGLKPTQQRNKALDKKKNILAAAGLMSDGVDIEAVFKEKVKIQLVDVSTGEYDESVDANSYDQRKAAKDPDQSVEIPDSADIAKIRRQAKLAAVYEIYEGNQLKQVVLPMHGKGLWSTLYGFMAIEADANTIVGLGFYEHAETPGLGGEIDNPKWKALWVGKSIYDDAHKNLKIEVIKGAADPTGPKFKHQIDGISGATITAVGVDKLVKYWLGERGFRKYLTKLRQRGNLNG